MTAGRGRARFDRDYYGTLGVAANAGDDEIRRAYRRLALRWHPDRNAGDPAATERFKEISEAYAVLIDPAKRREYDRVRTMGTSGGWQPSREDLFRDLFADPRASAVFEELTRELARMGVRVERRDFRDTLFGGRAVVTGTIIVVSPLAALTALLRLARAALGGARAGSTRDTRPALEPARPFWDRLLRAGRSLLGIPAPPSSLGSADVVVPLRLARREAIDGCRKRVALDGGDDVLVTIPAGMRSGNRLRLRGKGRTTSDGARGDAYLAVEIVDA